VDACVCVLAHLSVCVCVRACVSCVLCVYVCAWVRSASLVSLSVCVTHADRRSCALAARYVQKTIALLQRSHAHMLSSPFHETPTTDPARASSETHTTTTITYAHATHASSEKEVLLDALHELKETLMLLLVRVCVLCVLCLCVCVCACLCASVVGRARVQALWLCRVHRVGCGCVCE